MSINLLRRKIERRGKTALLAVRIAAGASLAIVAILAVGLFYLRSTSALPVIQKEAQLQSETVSRLSSKVLKFVFVGNQSTAVAEVLSKRWDAAGMMANIATLIPQGVSVTSLQIDKKRVVFGITTRNLSSLDLLFTKLTDMVAGNRLLKKVLIGGITLDTKNAVFSTTIEGEFL